MKRKAGNDVKYCYVNVHVFFILAHVHVHVLVGRICCYKHFYRFFQLGFQVGDIQLTTIGSVVL